MTYISPFHIISHFNHEETSFGEADLLRLQKKVLAEFNLQRTITISVAGKEYSKDELFLQLFAGNAHKDFICALQTLSQQQKIFNSKRIFCFVQVNYK